MEMSATEIRAAVAALPKLPTVWAVNMYAAQGLNLDADARAAVIARADFFESIGLSRSVMLKVINPRTGGLEGQLTFNI